MTCGMDSFYFFSDNHRKVPRH